MQRRGSVLFAALFGVLILGGAGFAYFTFHREPAEAPDMPEAEVIPEPRSPTAGWKTFTHDELGFTLKYPPHWTMGEGTGRNFNFEGIVSSTSREIEDGAASSSLQTLFFVQVRTRKRAMSVEELMDNLEDSCEKACPKAEAIFGAEDRRWVFARMESGESPSIQARFLRGREEFVLYLLLREGLSFPGQEMKDDELLALLAESFELEKARPDRTYVSPDFGFRFHLPEGAEGQEYLSEEDGGSGLMGGTIFSLPGGTDARSYVHVAVYGTSTGRAAAAGAEARAAGLKKATTTVNGRGVTVYHGMRKEPSGPGWPYLEALIPGAYLYDVIISNVASDPEDPTIRKYLESLMEG